MSTFSITTLNKIKSKNSPTFEIGKLSKNEIIEFEKKYDFILPDSYFQFLLEIGFFEIGSITILGLSNHLVEFGGISLDGIKYSNKIKYGSMENLIFDIKQPFNISDKQNKIVPIYEIGNGDYLAINLHQYNPKTKEAPIWYLAHEEFFDENFEQIKNPDYSLSVEEYEKRNWNFWRPTKYKDFKEMLMDAIDKKLSLTTF
ncbi:MAG: SMI1/KNR4 family protein [bacterium]